MMSDKKEYLSKEKFLELENELKDLSTNKRREIAENLEQAKSLGDLRENAEYQTARSAQSALEEKIAHLSDVLSRAVVINAHHSTKIEVGSTVKIRRTGAGGEHTLTIVGSPEADVNRSKISLESPLGKAMLGKGKGDNFIVKTGKGMVEYRVLDIE